MSNRLIHERSPYLLQHAENPVDWSPWSDDAFQLARREDRPIFLSIGYSTCHWCHVMAQESFENPEIARLLNEHFVPIKVDREERPDVDRVYMAFVQATTGAGGWPMSVWLTPDLKPFFGGTYFPPTARWGRPGLTEVLLEIARVWRTDRARLEQSAENVARQLATSFGSGAAKVLLDGAQPAIAGPETLRAGVREFAQSFDRWHGGFGGAPKFPRPSELLFLLAESARTGDVAARDMALDTLRAVAFGGVRDQIGGGFHRYSVDAEWRVPHFEKMLYDQAQLVLAYLEASQASGEGFCTSVAEDTLDYVLRDLADPGGGFYSAEDADSVPPDQAGTSSAHGAEGAFYLWTAAEIDAWCGAGAECARQRFGIELEGNAPSDPQGEFRGRNIPYIAQPVEAIAARTGRAIDDVTASVTRARRTLFEARRRRPRPHLDDKILTAWNGLMIAALARAARTWPSAERAASDLNAARRAARFVLDTMWDDERRVLRRRFRAGSAGIDAYAEDYAATVWGLLELLQADGDPAWLEWAVRLQARQDEFFWDVADGGWFSTTGADPSVLIRMKEDYDGAEPAAGSMAAHNAIVLHHLTGSDEAAHRAERALARLGPRLGELARAVPLMARILAAWHTGLTQIVIVGEPGREDTRRLHESIAGVYLPFAVVVPVAPGPRQDRLAAHMPWVRSMSLHGGRATAYFCRQFTCQAPTTDADELRRQLLNSRLRGWFQSPTS